MASSKRRDTAITSMGDSVLSKKKIKFIFYGSGSSWEYCPSKELAKKLIDYATLVNEQRVILNEGPSVWTHGKDILWVSLVQSSCPIGIYKRTDNTPELERETLAFIEEFSKLLEE